MNKLKFSTLLIILCNCFFTLSSQNSYIIGGESIQIEQVPFQVSIEKNEVHTCGGVILSPDWILTAAHCLTENVDYIVHAGATDQTDNNSGQRILVATKHSHLEWHDPTKINDIALLHLSKPLCFDNKVQPILLPTSSTDFAVGDVAYISGYGFSGDGQTGVLKGAITEIISNNEAEFVFNQANIDGIGFCPTVDITDSMISFYKSGNTASKGDSGGPATITRKGIKTLIGITNWGCNNVQSPNTLPAIYANVKEHLPFILSIIGDPNTPQDITIDNSQTNLGQNIIKGNIIVKAPAVLTINTDIYMMPGMEIIVENGAKLILDGGRITSIDGDCPQSNQEKKWKGVRAIGHPFLFSQSMISVELKNGAVIENAEIGINTSNLVFGGMFGSLNFSGSKITVDNSSIVNCNTGINMGPFGRYDVELWPGYNISTEDESFIHDSYIQAKVGIRLNGNRGFEVKENTTFQHDISTHPIGIWATNSKFSVDKTEFTGWNYPIVSNYSYPYPEGSSISESMFDSPTLIHWDNNSNLVSPTIFHENDFENGGIFMVGDNRFDITKNTFYGGSSAVEVAVTGVMNETYIKNNKFDGVAYGVYAYGANGTEINDNCFEQIAKDNVQLYDEANIFYNQGDFEIAAGNCFDKTKPIFKFGTDAEGFEYWIKNATSQVSCKHPGFPNTGEPWTLSDLSEFEYPDDCGSSGFSGGGGWNYAYRKCNVPDSVHLMLNMETTIKNQIIATQNNSGLSEWAKKRELARLRRCLKSVIGKITHFRLITEVDREAAITYLSSQDIFEVKIGAYGLMMHSGEYNRADSFLITLTYTTNPELDFKETQLIYLDFLSHRDTSLVDVADINTLYTIGSKKHEYAGFSRSVYSEITGEIIPVTTPKLGESEPRTQRVISTDKVNISPNPFNNKLLITSENSGNNIVSIKVYNSSGMLQQDIKLKANEISINTESWPSGLYFLEYLMENTYKGFTKVLRI